MPSYSTAQDVINTFMAQNTNLKYRYFDISCYLASHTMIHNIRLVFKTALNHVIKRISFKFNKSKLFIKILSI